MQLSDHFMTTAEKEVLSLWFNARSRTFKNTDVLTLADLMDVTVSPAVHGGLASLDREERAIEAEERARQEAEAKARRKGR